MKVLVTVKAILDTDFIGDKNVKIVIERSAFNKINDNLANWWAVSEIEHVNASKEISLELL